MNWYARHPRLMQRVLTACRSSSEFMTVDELAAQSRKSSKRVAQFIQILETYGYLFRTRENVNSVTQYRLIIEPCEHRHNQFQNIDA